jgi:hypothetical protein
MIAWKAVSSPRPMALMLALIGLLGRARNPSDHGVSMLWRWAVAHAAPGGA